MLARNEHLTCAPNKDLLRRFVIGGQPRGSTMACSNRVARRASRGFKVGSTGRGVIWKAPIEFRDVASTSRKRRGACNPAPAWKFVCLYSEKRQCIGAAIPRRCGGRRQAPARLLSPPPPPRPASPSRTSRGRATKCATSGPVQQSEERQTGSSGM